MSEDGGHREGGRSGSANDPDRSKRQVLFWVMVLLAGLYLAVRLAEGLMCVAAWLGLGSCPWSS